MNPALPRRRDRDGPAIPIDQQVTSLFSSVLMASTVRSGGDGEQLEDCPLVLAIAFSAHDTLASTSGIVAQTSPADVPELLRPSADALRTLRELDQLGIPLALFGDLPKPLLDSMAVVLWFSGQVVSVADPLVALPLQFGLPPECIWFVTADGDEAQRAVDAGFTAVHIASRASAAIEAPDRRGVYLLNTIEDLLDVIRAPYTRSALNLRLVIQALFTAKLDEVGAS
jgi:hypothetical protein